MFRINLPEYQNQEIGPDFPHWSEHENPFESFELSQSEKIENFYEKNSLDVSIKANVFYFNFWIFL